MTEGSSGPIPCEEAGSGKPGIQAEPVIPFVMVAMETINCLLLSNKMPHNLVGLNNHFLLSRNVCGLGTQEWLGCMFLAQVSPEGIDDN